MPLRVILLFFLFFFFLPLNPDTPKAIYGTNFIVFKVLLISHNLMCLNVTKVVIRSIKSIGAHIENIWRNPINNNLIF